MPLFHRFLPFYFFFLAATSATNAHAGQTAVIDHPDGSVTTIGPGPDGDWQVDGYDSNGNHDFDKSYGSNYTFQDVLDGFDHAEQGDKVVDTGTTPDASAAPDTGTPAPDASAAPDTGTPAPDTSAPPDTGTPAPDASAAPDSSTSSGEGSGSDGGGGDGGGGGGSD